MINSVGQYQGAAHSNEREMLLLGDNRLRAKEASTFDYRYSHTVTKVLIRTQLQGDQHYQHRDEEYLPCWRLESPYLESNFTFALLYEGTVAR